MAQADKVIEKYDDVLELCNQCNGHAQTLGRARSLGYQEAINRAAPTEEDLIFEVEKYDNYLKG